VVSGGSAALLPIPLLSFGIGTGQIRAEVASLMVLFVWVAREGKGRMRLSSTSGLVIYLYQIDC
jgi:hypothetical protein